jgi:hypothetical protein
VLAGAIMDDADLDEVFTDSLDMFLMLFNIRLK